MIIAPERGKAACKCLLQTISIASVDSPDPPECDFPLPIFLFSPRRKSFHPVCEFMDRMLEARLQAIAQELTEPSQPINMRPTPCVP